MLSFKSLSGKLLMLPFLSLAPLFILGLLQCKHLRDWSKFVGFRYVIVFVQIDFAEKKNILASDKEKPTVNIGVEVLHEESFDCVLQDEVAFV